MWSCVTWQGHKSHERSSDLSECRVSSPLVAQQDKSGSRALEQKATAADQAPQACASRRALAHSPSGKGSSSLDEVIPQPHSVLADSDGDITLSAGRDTLSAGGVTGSAKAVTQSAEGVTRSAGAVTQSGEGVTNDSSQACSSVQLAQGDGATGMAQLAEAAAVMCSEEKALQAQRAG